MNISNCFFKPAAQYFKPIYEALTIQHKKILALAMAIFSCMAIYYAVKYLTVQKRCQGEKVKNRIRHQTLQAKAAVDVKNRPIGTKDLQLKNTYLTSLPVEVQLSILEMLNVKGWNSITSVNRSLYQLSKKPRGVAALLENTRASLLDRLKQITLAGPCLHKLNLHRSNLSDSEQENIFKACPNIRELNLKQSNITDARLDKLPSGLTSLNLTCCYQITDAGLDKLPSGL